MDILKSEKGVTLLEVLLAMTILSIVFISFMSMFPQMGMMNKHNEDKTQAINSAKQVLNQLKSDENVKKYISNPITSNIPSGLTLRSTSSTFYTFEKANPKAEIKIWSQMEAGYKLSDEIKAYKIEVQIINDRDLPISETYGYVFVK